ncbi:DUF6945 domain-containing protein [Raoultella ornithinolytica]|uniref:DUF6945 domain-containing protein n=1 Tax=Raoultella ornithinolytica TaxID=54291 RepID=UPI001F3895DC|nr:hypothetical protein [Raoultella ornithinolytica]MCE9801726.1 hypothetical protein [Raoultella ornithinolytica]MCE9810573.1 hypothetical protein [Raoultella ornithinolytica]MCE9866275.1 hypothetical protein [Raoultella ornithinolytica]
MRAKNTKSQTPPPPAEPYTTIEMRLVCASKIKIVNGKHAGTVIDWDANMLRVYLYMFNQVKSFESRHGEFYQSQDRIKLSVGLGKTKVNEVLDALKMLGLIRKTGKQPVKGAPRGLIKYTAVRLLDVIGNLEIIFADDDGEPVWDHERASGKKVKKYEGKHGNGNGHEEATEPQAEPVNQPADTPTGQSPGVAPESAPVVAGQRDRVESDDGGGSNAGNAGNHAVSQELKKDAFPWRGDTFIKNRLSENAYQWAITAGATDWRHACRLVWEKAGVRLPTEIDEHFKPLSLC